MHKKKEHLFTKRIYHTHHKAEKVMGFINEDLENVNKSNFEEIKYRVSKYANFIGRVIYDMKWFNPPIHTMRGNLFNTDLNELLRFIINNIFLRVSNPVSTIKFNFDFDETLPKIKVNEFVMWEIIEPIIQNSIDHSDKDIIEILIKTQYNQELNCAILIIKDNGTGVPMDLMEFAEDGTRKIFLENLSTKIERTNHGYGCYIAFEIAKRCGWNIEIENNTNGGCSFILQIIY
ncbi:MAG: HAMP domain-containing histidine kinase [Ignavibacteriales bacterium]|nr:HAMP domain-containing histidine kinase [Ignavibacteriales bacterium]